MIYGRNTLMLMNIFIIFEVYEFEEYECYYISLDPILEVHKCRKDEHYRISIFELYPH